MPSQLQVVFLPPSATGKSTTQRILGDTGEYEIGTTSTNRSPRQGESPGAYDWAPGWRWWWYVLTGQVQGCDGTYGRRYGIRRRRIRRAHEADRPTLWALTVAGLEFMRREFGPENVLPILLWAPRHILRQRMEKRGDAPADIATRLANAPAEVARALDAGAVKVDVTDLTPEDVAAEVRRQIKAWQSRRR